MHLFFPRHSVLHGHSAFVFRKEQEHKLYDLFSLFCLPGEAGGDFLGGIIWQCFFVWLDLRRTFLGLQNSLKIRGSGPLILACTQAVR